MPMHSRTTPLTREELLAELDRCKQTIAELNERNNALRYSEQYYRQFVEDTDDLVTEVNNEGKITFVNRIAETIWGIPAEDCIGLSAFTLVHPGDRGRTESAFKGWVKSSVRSVRYENRQVNQRTGEVRGILWTINIHYDTHGALESIKSTARDQTKAHQAAEALRASEQKFVKAFHASPDAVTITNVATGTIVDANERIFDLTGYLPSDVVGKTTLELGMWPRESDRVRMIEILQRDGSIRGLGVTIAHTSEKNRDCLLFAEQVQIQGKPHLLAFTRDITKAKRNERDKAALLEQLHHAQKMESLGQLAGGVAHDINNMLTVVTGTISLLDIKLAAGDPLHGDYDRILKACFRGHDLTRNLLGFARKGKVAPARVALDELVSETKLLLRKTVAKGIEILIKSTAGLRPIEADSAQLSHVLLNLCLNATDAMGRRGVLRIATSNATVHADTALGVAPGPYVRLTVSDTGSGMAPETRERAFDPFFTTKPPGEGTGLGLSMVYGTVENHGGTVTIDSNEGEGTTVTVWLPAIDSPTIENTGPQPDRAQHDALGTVLLVDDEELVRDVGTQLLSDFGFNVLVANNGQQAVDLYQNASDDIELVMLDLSMPVMDGRETFDKLKTLDPDVQVLIYSGHFKDGEVDDLLRQGAKGFLQKPFTEETLALALAKALEDKTT